jgi:hypothetical protein
MGPVIVEILIAGCLFAAIATMRGEGAIERSGK